MFERTALDENWNNLIVHLTGAHLLQTKEWAEVKAKVGWKASPLVWRNASGGIVAGALLLTRSARLTRLGPEISICYAPRGPLLDWKDRELAGIVINDLQGIASEQKALFLKIDPEMRLGTGVPGSSDSCEDADGNAILESMKGSGWRFSASQIQFRNTFWIDLTASPEAWLGRMKQKTRYNIRLAERKGVQVRSGTVDDLPLLYRMYAETSLRDGFVIRPEGYYHHIWQTFMQNQMAQALIAEVEGQPVAGLMLLYFGKTAYYLYGMSRPAHREKMPNHLLQWEAMKRAQAAGCTRYDLWGAPDRFEEADSMWGVYRFKEGLGGTVVQTLGAWDYVCRPFAYLLYTRIAPAVLELMRRRGKSRTRQEVGL